MASSSNPFPQEIPQETWDAFNANPRNEILVKRLHAEAKERKSEGRNMILFPEANYKGTRQVAQEMLPSEKRRVVAEKLQDWDEDFALSYRGKQSLREEYRRNYLSNLSFYLGRELTEEDIEQVTQAPFYRKKIMEMSKLVPEHSLVNIVEVPGGIEGEKRFVDSARWYEDYMEGNSQSNWLSAKEGERRSKKMWDAVGEGLTESEARRRFNIYEDAKGNPIEYIEGSPERADIDYYPAYGEKQTKELANILSMIYKDQDIDLGIMGHYDPTMKYMGVDPETLKESLSVLMEEANVGNCFLGACNKGEESETVRRLSEALGIPVHQQGAQAWGVNPYKKRENTKDVDPAIMNTFFHSSAPVISSKPPSFWDKVKEFLGADE